MIPAPPCIVHLFQQVVLEPQISHKWYQSDSISWSLIVGG